MMAPLLVVESFCAPPLLACWLALVARRDDARVYWLRQEIRRLSAAMQAARETGDNIYSLAMFSPDSPGDLLYYVRRENDAAKTETDRDTV